MVVQSNDKFDSDIWYVDNDSNNYMCGSKSSFAYLNEIFQSIVSFGDLSSIDV